MKARIRTSGIARKVLGKIPNVHKEKGEIWMNGKDSPTQESIS